MEQQRIRLFTETSTVLGISYQGDSHVHLNIPCQDFHSFTQINEFWRVAIVSDGAGSGAISNIGSKLVCASLNDDMKQFLCSKQYADGTLPDAKTWDIEFKGMLEVLQGRLMVLKEASHYEYADLAATLILLAYSPKGYLFAHIGDGRAGVKVGNEWSAIITPHKGEEANQTIFCTTIRFSDQPNMKMSGVYVPETGVSADVISAFVLMSDGLENGLWHTSERIDLPDGDFRWKPRNQPFVKGIESALDIIHFPTEEREEALTDFIVGYNRPLRKEPDDKTILIGLTDESLQCQESSH